MNEMEIKTTDQLRVVLAEAGKASRGFEETFERLAHALFNNFVIRKGRATYRFAEIEFYHCKAYEPRNGKRTYHRTAKAGEWFFHASGVDLCFESNDGEGEEIYYGGILIRSITDGDRFVMGPQRVVDTLFQNVDALSPSTEVFHLEEEKAQEQIVPERFYRFHYDDSEHEEHPKYRFALPESLWSREQARITVENWKTGKISSYLYDAYPYK